MPKPNAGLGTVAMDKYLTVIGGKSGKGSDLFSNVWALDTTEKNAEWIEGDSCMYLPRCEFSITKIDGKVFVCGGLHTNKNDSNCQWSDNMEMFDGEVWKNGPKLPIPRVGAPVTIVPMNFAKDLT